MSDRPAALHNRLVDNLWAAADTALAKRPGAAGAWTTPASAELLELARAKVKRALDELRLPESRER